MNKEKVVTFLTYAIVIIFLSCLFFAGLTVGVLISKPENTWTPDTNSIQFRKSIQIDGNLYVKGKIYKYKGK